MDIKSLVKEAHQNAVEHGFWDDVEISVNRYGVVDILKAATCREVLKNCRQELSNEICTRLMLIVGEVSEAMEGLRKGDNYNFKEELADIIIRTCDLCGGLDIDLEAEIKKKMEINKSRPYKHGKKF